uniref:Uncharacterized protein n=1 Tax=Rhizophora mucronata TaxID=61149 RepID=A0A2P2NUS0_RHIMU
MHMEVSLCLLSIVWKRRMDFFSLQHVFVQMYTCTVTHSICCLV